MGKWNGRAYSVRSGETENFQELGVILSSSSRQEGSTMPKPNETIRLKRNDTKEQGTRVRKIEVRETRVAITIYLGKQDARRLAKVIERKWS